MNLVFQAKVILLAAFALGLLDAARVRVRYSIDSGYSGGSRYSVNSGYFGGSRYSVNSGYFGGSRYSVDSRYPVDSGYSSSDSYIYSQSDDVNAPKTQSLYKSYLDSSDSPVYRTTLPIAGPGMGGLTVNKHAMVLEGSVYIAKDLNPRVYTSTNELNAESVEKCALCSGRIYNYFLCPSDLFGGVFEEHSKYCCGPHGYQMCCSVDDYNEQLASPAWPGLASPASPESLNVLPIVLIVPMTIAVFGICVCCSIRACSKFRK